MQKMWSISKVSDINTKMYLGDKSSTEFSDKH